MRCTATDANGNASAAQTFTVTVLDRAGPVITFVGGPLPGRTYTPATLPAEPTCTATDTSSTVTQCRVYGYCTAPDTHMLTARARDAEGNSSVSSRTYTVTADAPTATPRPPTSTPRPATATASDQHATASDRDTATPTRTARPKATPVVPPQSTVRPVVPQTAKPVPPTATPVIPTVSTATPPPAPT